jgi:hypothetical protein
VRGNWVAIHSRARSHAWRASTSQAARRRLARRIPWPIRCARAGEWPAEWRGACRRGKLCVEPCEQPARANEGKIGALLHSHLVPPPRAPTLRRLHISHRGCGKFTSGRLSHRRVSVPHVPDVNLSAGRAARRSVGGPCDTRGERRRRPAGSFSGQLALRAARVRPRRVLRRSVSAGLHTDRALANEGLSVRTLGPVDAGVRARAGSRPGRTDETCDLGACETSPVR